MSRKLPQRNFHKDTIDTNRLRTLAGLQENKEILKESPYLNYNMPSSDQMEFDPEAHSLLVAAIKTALSFNDSMKELVDYCNTINPDNHLQGQIDKITNIQTKFAGTVFTPLNSLTRTE